MPLSHHPQPTSIAAPPPGGQPAVGFNFRETSGLSYPVGDNYVGVATSNLYPTAYTDSLGGSVNAGWTPTAQPNPGYLYDVAVTPVRLQGAQGVLGNFWRTALASGKSFRVWMGYCIFVAGNRLDIYIRDGDFGGPILYTMDATAPNALQAIDVLGNVTSADAWESAYGSSYVDLGPVTEISGGMGELTVDFRGNGTGYISHVRFEELP